MPADPPAPPSTAPGMRRWLERLAVAGALVHALFLPISIAGMQIGLGVALGALVLLRVTGVRSWRHGPLDAPCLLLVGGALVSLLLGTIGGSPPVGWFEATLWRSVLAPLVLVSAFELGGPRAAPRLALLALAVWAIAALLPSAVAWAQLSTGIDPLYALGLRARPVRATVPTFPGRFAAVGFFKWYQRLAHNLTPPLLVAAAVALVPEVPRRTRIVLAVGAVAAAVAVVFTLSRAAWVALVAGALVIVVRSRGRLRAWGLAAIAVATLAMLLHPGVQARLRHLTVRGDNADRVEIWNVCRAIIADHPLTGVGWGNLPRRAVPYYDRIQHLGEMRAWCHDSFLSAWAEGGPLLFAAVVGYWLLLLRAFWRGGRSVDPIERAAAAGGLAAVAAMLLNALAHDVFYSSEAVYGLGFAAAVAAVLGRLNAPGEPSS